MKSGGEISTIEQNVPNWGGGTEAHAGDILMADGTMDHKEGRDVEWEVSCVAQDDLSYPADGWTRCM